MGGDKPAEKNYLERIRLSFCRDGREATVVQKWMRKQCRRATLPSHLQFLIHKPLSLSLSLYNSTNNFHCFVSTYRNSKSQYLISYITLVATTPSSSFFHLSCLFIPLHLQGTATACSKNLWVFTSLSRRWGRSPMSRSTRPSPSKNFRR